MSAATSLGSVGVVEAIFVATSGGESMRRLDRVEAVAGAGLLGDRYLTRRGYWTGVDECQVTLIEAEGLEDVSARTGVSLADGPHRRNRVTRHLSLRDLEGRRFRIGGAVLEYDRPRPPCRYIESITEPGMTRALGARRGGICARVLEGGVIRSGDRIELLDAEAGVATGGGFRFRRP